MARDNAGNIRYDLPRGHRTQIYYDGSGTGGFITMTDAGYIEDGDYRGSYTPQSRNYSIRALVLG